MTFQQDTEETPVIFRKWNDGSIIALFPADPGTNHAYTCSSYEHVGQHGAAEPVGVIRRTRPATPQEYADLKRELESAPYGYRLKVFQRLHYSFLDIRRAALRRVA